jgi:ABC-type multidrug transport system fused ATPase/permease subunit
MPSPDLFFTRFDAKASHLQDSHLLRQFFEYYRPQTRLFWVNFGSAVLSGLLELALPLAITAFIDHLLPLGDWGLTVLSATGLLLVYAFNTLLMGIVIYWGHRLGIEIEGEMRRRAFAHLTRLPWRWYDRARTCKLVARVTRDLEEIGEVAHHHPEDLFIAVMTFVGAFLLIMNLHVTLALITAVIVPLMVWVVAVYGARTTRSWRDIYARVGAFNVRLEEAISGIRVVQAFKGEVRFANASFACDSSLPALQGVTITIKAGETVAFVGPSGAGKTTLLDLLSRLYDPTGGSITIDGIDVADMALNSLRAQIGLVSLDVFLFGSTLRSNILYGKLGASDAEMTAAVENAQLSALFARLPAGLDTVVGERGVMLSGSQKQRVAIARAFLKNPPILVLDEATPGLDRETEREIQQALEQLSKGAHDAGHRASPENRATCKSDHCYGGRAKG